MRKIFLLGGAFVVLLVAVNVIAQTNAKNLRVKTDANSYLITSGAAYTAPDGPLTAFNTIKLRTDANGYLLTTSSPTSNSFGYFADGSALLPSITFATQTNMGLYRSAASEMSFSSGNSQTFVLGTTYVRMPASVQLDWSGDTVITRRAAGQFGITATLFSSLGTPSNGTFTYCSDCTVTTPATCPATAASCICAASGTGALAVRLNGSWDCAIRQ